MTYTFKTFSQPNGTYRYKVYNGPMVLRQGLCRNRKEAEIAARTYIKSGQAEREAFKFCERWERTRT